MKVRIFSRYATTYATPYVFTFIVVSVLRTILMVIEYQRRHIFHWTNVTIWHCYCTTPRVHTSRRCYMALSVDCYLIL